MLQTSNLFPSSTFGNLFPWHKTPQVSSYAFLSFSMLPLRQHLYPPAPFLRSLKALPASPSSVTPAPGGISIVWVPQWCGKVKQLTSCPLRAVRASSADSEELNSAYPQRFPWQSQWLSDHYKLNSASNKIQVVHSPSTFTAWTKLTNWFHAPSVSTTF